MKDFYISKSNGEWRNVKAMKEHWDSLPDGRYVVKIKSTQKRSLPQNAWFHAILPDIVEGLRDIGYNEVRTTEDAKDIIKALFFKKTVSNGSESIEVIEGTSEQSKINFAEKAEDIIFWAYQYLGIDIAPPEKQFDLYEEKDRTPSKAD